MWRSLTTQERTLLACVLSRAPQGKNLIEQLGSVRVSGLDDGGMGSLKFEPMNTEAQHLGRSIAKAEFLDEDGVPVSLVVNVDQAGNLFELDMWKTDFSRLKRWPNSEEVAVRV